MRNINEVFRSIKDGTIIRMLPDYQNLKLNNGNVRSALDSVIEYHRKKYVFPTLDDLIKSMSFCDPTIRNNCRVLIKDGILYNFITPDIFDVFGYWEVCKPHFPKEIDYATRGNIKIFNKKKLKNHTSNSKHFYLAALKKDGEPVFKNIFSFLPQYKTESISVQL